MRDYFQAFNFERELLRRAETIAQGHQELLNEEQRRMIIERKNGAHQQQQQQQMMTKPIAQMNKQKRSKRDRILSFLLFKGDRAVEPLRSHRLLDERERIFGLSEMPLKWITKRTNDENENAEAMKVDQMHRKMLMTIYAKLTGEYRHDEVLKRGKHWEEIGFQGEDPATDLRACGVLAVCNLLAFVSTQSTTTTTTTTTTAVSVSASAIAVHRLSRCPGQQFPLCALGVTFTSWALRMLENGFFNDHVENDSVNHNHTGLWDLFDSYYIGCWISFYKTWKKGKYSLKDAKDVLANLDSVSPHSLLSPNRSPPSTGPITKRDPR